MMMRFSRTVDQVTMDFLDSRVGFPGCVFDSVRMKQYITSFFKKQDLSLKGVSISCQELKSPYVLFSCLRMRTQK